MRDAVSGPAGGWSRDVTSRCFELNVLWIHPVLDGCQSTANRVLGKSVISYSQVHSAKVQVQTAVPVWSQFIATSSGAASAAASWAAFSASNLALIRWLRGTGCHTTWKTKSSLSTSSMGGSYSISSPSGPMIGSVGACPLGSLILAAGLSG